jgi:hypothetical protein
MVMSINLHAQLRIHSYGIDIANSVNGISVGYQDFESLGMKTNFITKGQPEFSLFNPMIGLSIIAEYDPLNFIGRISYDDRSGFIKDEIEPGSLSMHPQLRYITFESALMIKPWDIFSIYGGPSLSFLLNHSIGKIGENINTNQLSNMNSPIPGIFAGISAEFQLNQSVHSLPIHISPFLETSLIFNQRTGEFPENQDGFDNIWSTFSLRTGISITLNPSKEKLAVSHPFTLKIPTEMSGKRSMNEHIPLIMQWPATSFLNIIHEAHRNPEQFNIPTSLLCTKSDLPFQHEDIKIQRTCIEERSIHFLLNYLKTSMDTCYIKVCSNVKQTQYKKELIDICKSILRIDTSRLQFNACEQNHEHSDYFKATFSSGHIPIVEMDFESVSPPENVIICSLQSQNPPKEWFIDISGPQKYKKTFGPFTATSVHLDGSELLQGEAGTGSYECTVRYTNEQERTLEFTEEFRIQMSNENKMQGHAFTYLPLINTDSMLYQQISRDIKQYAKSQDEILIIMDKSASNELQNKVKDIQLHIFNEMRKQHKVIRKEITIIEKGSENALYNKLSTWGKVYEQGIRVEIIH